MTIKEIRKYFNYKKFELSTAPVFRIEFLEDSIIFGKTLIVQNIKFSDFTEEIIEIAAKDGMGTVYITERKTHSSALLWMGCKRHTNLE